MGFQLIILYQYWFTGFPSGSVVKNLPANVVDARDVGWIPRLGRSPGVRNGNPQGQKESDMTEHTYILALLAVANVSYLHKI